MKRKVFSILFALVLAVSLVLMPAAVSAGHNGGVLWGVTGVNFYYFDDYSEVFRVDTTTGAVTVIAAGISAAATGPLYTDIAMTPNGNLYTVGMDRDGTHGSQYNFYDFYRLDPATGAILGSWINIFPLNDFRQVNALAAESNTSLLAIEGGAAWNPKLLRITLDGAGDFASVTSLGVIAADGAATVLSDGDLDRDPISGKWYAGFYASAGSEMLELNLADPGNSTLISQSNIQWQGGFAFLPDGTAYAGSWADRNLYTVDVLAGGSSFAHDLSAQLRGNIFGLSSAHLEVEILEVEIDIKPWSFPNSINPNSKGVIPVAILTTSDFDAATVDAETVRFGPDEAEAVQWDLEDADGDGDIDMVLHFKTQDTGIQAGDNEATLTGETVGGQVFAGTDSVRTVGK